LAPRRFGTHEDGLVAEPASHVVAGGAKSQALLSIVDLIAPNLLLAADSKPDPPAFEVKPHPLWPGIHLLLF